MTGSGLASHAAQIQQAIKGYERALKRALETLGHLKFVPLIVLEITELLKSVTLVWFDTCGAERWDRGLGFRFLAAEWGVDAVYELTSMNCIRPIHHARVHIFNKTVRQFRSLLRVVGGYFDYRYSNVNFR